MGKAIYSHHKLTAFTPFRIFSYKTSFIRDFQVTLISGIFSISAKMHRVFALSLLSLLAPFGQAIRIQEDVNRASGPVEVLQEGDREVGLFIVGPERAGQDEFSYSITISPENAGEGGGSEWGLVQNILRSTRLSSYADNNFINIRPTREPPILDGGVDIPYFDDRAFGKLNDGGSLTLTITDGPNIITAQDLYLSDQGPNGPKAALSSFSVDETFRITLVQKQNDNSFLPFFQCDWSYSYTLNALRDGTIVTPTASKCTEVQPVSPPIVTPPVATESAFRQYDPAANSAFNEVRFNSGRNPTPTPTPSPANAPPLSTPIPSSTPTGTPVAKRFIA